MKEAIIQYNDDPDADGSHMVISWKELVRCEDCIWFHKPDAETKRSCKCNYHGCVTEGDRYCWWGEKDV